ncbi:MAG: uroporphyrinogen decarboxylase family protein [Verrucomicrobiae bacterium]|nr:uroporphyrinogen decarboxylase family protein [Verrucomicrobiae bacterium]
MLPRERVIAALEHREADRIPWGEHSIDYNVYEDILGRPTWVQAKMKETQAYWDGRRDEVVASYKRDRLDLIRALDMDIVFVGAVPLKGYQPKPFEKLDAETYRDEKGNLYRVSATTHDLMLYQKNTADYQPPTLSSLQEQIDRLEEEPLGDPNGSEWELARHAVKEMKKSHFIMLLVGALGFPGFGATEEDFWTNLLVEPEICQKIAELQGKRQLRQIKLYAQLGVDAIMACSDLGSSTSLLANPKIYREMMYPWDQAQAQEARRFGLKVIRHCCGHTWQVIDELAEVYDAYEGIQASGGMDIRKLKEQVGSHLCLWGGIWHEHIIMGTVKDIQNDARYSFQHAASGGGYIMGSSHSLAVGAKSENILEMKRCRDEWGTYPVGSGPGVFKI